MSTPRHVAIIMDGNGRWAKKRFLPRLLGHRAGIHALERILRSLKGKGVEHLSVFAFSTENWKRPEIEVKGLMKLFAVYVERKVEELIRDGYRVRFAGRRSDLSPQILELFDRFESRDVPDAHLTLTVCFNYGGQDEIIRAFSKAAQAGVQIKKTEDLQPFLDLPDLPNPDLIIRTGGELRLSNFWLWQSAYSEYYFTDTFWPDFSPEELDKAIQSFGNRDRRYGAV